MMMINGKNFKVFVSMILLICIFDCKANDAKSQHENIKTHSRKSSNSVNYWTHNIYDSCAQLISFHVGFNDLDYNNLLSKITPNLNGCSLNYEKIIEQLNSILGSYQENFEAKFIKSDNVLKLQEVVSFIKQKKAVMVLLDLGYGLVWKTVTAVSDSADTGDFAILRTFENEDSLSFDNLSLKDFQNKYRGVVIYFDEISVPEKKEISEVSKGSYKDYCRVM